MCCLHAHLLVVVARMLAFVVCLLLIARARVRLLACVVNNATVND